MTKENLLVISLGFVNVFVLRGKGTVLIDTGMPQSENKIIQRLEELSIKPSEISLILITHGHVDHFGSALAMKELTGARIAIHKADAENLRKGVNGENHPTGLLGRFLGLLNKKEKSIGNIEPDITFEDEIDLEEYGVKARVISTPGHTPGSISIMLDNGEIIVGDLMMGSMITNKPRYPIVADDLIQLKNSIRKIVKSNPKKVYTGHGKAFARDDIVKNFKQIDFS